MGKHLAEILYNLSTFPVLLNDSCKHWNLHISVIHLENCLDNILKGRARKLHKLDESPKHHLQAK